MATLILMATVGIQFALSEAHRTPENAYVMRSKAMALTYNLASYTWPGWNEPGLAIDAAQLATGYSAARANLRLAAELGKGDLACSRAHWIVGLHALAVANWSAAIENLPATADYARKADSKADKLLALGYIALTEILRDPTNADAKQRLAGNKSQLAQLEHGNFFIQQLDNALAVFQTDE